MKRPLILSAAICALLGSAIFAFADIARPKPSPAEPKSVFYTGLTVVPDAKASEARLQISQELIKQLHEKVANNGGVGALVSRGGGIFMRTHLAGALLLFTRPFSSVSCGRRRPRT